MGQGAVIRDPTPEWLKPENASVLDSTTTKALRWIASVIGADSPSAQVLGLMSTLVPSAGKAGGLVNALTEQIAKVKLADSLAGAAGPAGHMPPATLEAAPDVLPRHPEHLRQLSVPDAAVVQGFGGVDVKRRSDMLSMMRGLLQDPKIGQAVVRLLPVEVMHMLGGQQRSPQMLLHQPSMLVELLPRHADDLVASRVQAVDVLAPYVARAAAEHTVALDSAPVSDEGFTTRAAFQNNRHMSGEIPYPSPKGNTAGEGTRNFVVFDDTIIDILRKYGIALPASLAGHYGVQQMQEGPR